ncbi:MAG: hypothetical protein JSS66_06530 [Armatimonadetes bacterium]|nr:hypothetical protein [Armatimonadota bacterium]
MFKYTADQIHAKRVVKQVMFDLTAKTGLSPRSFSSILVYCEHQPYAQLLNVWAQLDGRQLRDLYERKCPQETEVRELMNVSLQKLGIDFCRLRIYRKPTYVFDLDELCTMDSPSFLADIQQRISATLKKSLSSGTRDYRPSARKTCGYLVPREHAHSVRQHGVIPVSYAKRGHKTCFGLEAPFELCVFVRPDRKLWMSTWLPAGTVRTMALDELCSEQLGGLLDSVLTEK